MNQIEYVLRDDDHYLDLNQVNIILITIALEFQFDFI